MKKVITIFGSSLPVEGDEEYTIAYNLGTSLAQEGYIVCNGGNKGIMEATARGAFELGKETIGITCDLFPNSNNPYITTRIRCKTLFERIDKLISTADAFIVLQGGTGTLLEIAAIWEYMNKGLLPIKPAVTFGVMWESIINEMEKQIVREQRKTGLISCVSTIEECINILNRKL